MFYYYYYYYYYYFLLFFPSLELLHLTEFLCFDFVAYSLIYSNFINTDNNDKCYLSNKSTY